MPRAVGWAASPQRDRKGYVWIPGELPGASCCSFVPLSLNRHTEQTQSNMGMTTKGSELSGMKVCITSSKPLRTPEVIVGVRGFQSGVVKGGEEEAHWQPWDQ